MKRIGIDGFLIGIVVAILLAYFFPQAGLMQAPFSLEDFTEIGIALIFFFYGLKLSFTDLKNGLSNWRMHLVIQITTFIYFPLLLLALKPFFLSEQAQQIWLGIFFLSALPSAVSSAVVLVSVAGGNVPAAIFNASLSSLMGIFITPLWVGLVISTTGHAVETSAITTKLGIQVLLPAILGLLLHNRFGAWVIARQNQLKRFDQSVLLTIIYISFCKSFEKHIFSNFQWWELTLLVVGMAALFFSIRGMVYIVSRILNFNTADQITVLFCGSKKSLMHGTVMAKVLFPASASLGIIVLPLMIYHALQIILSSIIAQRIVRKQK